MRVGLRSIRTRHQGVCAVSSKIHESFVSSAPKAPDARSLEAVRATAKARARRERVGKVPPVRVAGLVALAAVIVAGALVLAPQMRGGSAFAHTRAISALMPEDGVLHVTWTLVTSPVGVPEETVTGENWIDAAAGQERSSLDRGDGGIAGLTVRQGSELRSLGRDPGTGAYLINQYDLPLDDYTPFGGYIRLLVDGLKSGDTTVIDKVEVDGESCWVVERELAPSTEEDRAAGGTDERVKAVLREGDYRLKELSLYRPHDGEWTREVYASFSVWETVGRGTLPKNFFDFAEVDKAAPKDTPVTVEPGVDK